MNTPFDTHYEIELYKRLAEPTNPYVMYNNTDRMLNVAYRYFTIGNLGEFYKKWNDGTAIPGPQNFLYERATNVVSQNYWAGTAILGLAYSAQRPDLYSSREGSENKDILGQLTLARSVINAVIETGLSLANIYRWRASQGTPDPGPTGITIFEPFPITLNVNLNVNVNNVYIQPPNQDFADLFDPQPPNTARGAQIIIEGDLRGFEEFDNNSTRTSTSRRNGPASARVHFVEPAIEMEDLRRDPNAPFDATLDGISVGQNTARGPVTPRGFEVNENASVLNERNLVKTIRAYGTTIASAGFTLNAIISVGIQSKLLANAINSDKLEGSDKRIAIASASLGLATSVANIGANLSKSLAGFGSTIPLGTGESTPRWLPKKTNRFGIAGSALGLANGVLGIATLAPLLANDKLTAEQRGVIAAEMGVQLLGGVLQAGSNGLLAVRVARGLGGAALATPLLGAAVGALVVAMSPLEIYGLVQQSKYADRLDELGKEMEPYGYEGNGLLASLYRDKTGKESGILGATTLLSVIGSAVSIASLVSGIGAPAAIVASLATAIAAGVLKGVQQSIIENIAEDYAAKIVNSGGSMAYFAKDLLAQHGQILNNAEDYLKELQSDFGVDSVIGVATPLLSKQAMELAAITRNAADLKTATSYVDRFVDGKVAADQSLRIDPATGSLDLGGAVDQKQLLTFLNPLLSSGQENRVRAKVGKDAYKTSLEVIEVEGGNKLSIGAGGWAITDGAASSTMDLRKVISSVLSDDGKTTKSIALNVQGGAGDDVVIAGASAMTFDGGVGSNLVSYGSVGGGITVSANAQGGFTVEKRLTNTSIYQETTSSQDFVYGKRTETVEYRDYKLITGVEQTASDTLLNVESIRGTASRDSITGNDKNNMLDGRGGDDTVNGGDGDDTLLGGAGNDIVNGGDGNDVIMQDLETGGDTLNGGEGMDRVDYSATNAKGRMSSGLTIDLRHPTNGAVTVTKVLAGTAVSLNATGRYIRIYHTSAEWLTLALTELKVFVGGINVAVGRESGVGADGVTVANDPRNNSGALTDGVAGGPRNYDKSNMAVVAGVHAYIELDLMSSYNIDSLALWGVDGYADFAKDLRIYVSNNAFDNTATAYADLAANPTVTQIDLASVETTPTTTYTDTLIGIENLVGTALNDNLTGDADPNMLVGGGGNDVLNGDAGNDRLAGGTGSDIVNAGDGNDVIEQDLGYDWDTLNGGDGNDTVDYSISGMEGYIVAKLSLNQQGAQEVKKFRVNSPPNVTETQTPTDTLVGIENLVGTAMGDKLYGDEKANVLFGGAGNDTLFGGDGGDTLSGGVGQDTVSGENGDDQIVQGLDQAADLLDGGDGNDTVNYNYSAGSKTQNLKVVLNDDGTGTATKTFYGTAASVGQAGRYIRIYHSDSASSSRPLSLTGLKVYAGGVDVAAGKPNLTSIGSDDGQFDNPANNNLAALTDGAVGGAYNGSSSSASNIVSVLGAGKTYIELDLGSVQDIDEIALWGVKGSEPSSDNLRVYVSQDPFPTSATAYADLAANTAVKRVDFGVVDTNPSTTVVDTLTSIENVTVNGVAMSGSPASTSGLRGRQFSALSDSAGSGGLTVTGDVRSNLLLGGDGDETFSGAAGDDTLSSGAGNDTLNGDAGNDLLAGGAGRDSVNGGDGDDLIVQDIDTASDTLTGGAGNDTVDYSITDLAGIASTTGIVANLGANGDGQGLVAKGVDISAVVGATGRYIRIYATQAGLALSGLKVYAGGFDVAAGKPTRNGADIASTEDDYGYTMNNPFALTDAQVGNAWNEKFSGDSNVAATDAGIRPYIELDLGSAQDIYAIALWGVAGLEYAGNNLRVYVSSTPFVSSATAYDDLAADPAVARVDVASVQTHIAGSFTDTLSGIENLVGTALADTITGDAGANTLSAGAGNDVVAGGAGDDNLLGEDGNDILKGGAGGDMLSGGDGRDIVSGEGGDDVIQQDLEAYVAGSSGVWDTLDGGDGVDTVDYSTTVFPKGTRPLMGGTGIYADLSTGKITRYSGAGFDSYDTVTHIENVVGTMLADTIIGDANDNALSGDAGNDVLVGNAGNDFLLGGDGNDRLNGGAGNDTLSGDLGMDSVSGGDGDDMILQDMEGFNETLDGGDGDDTVDYSMTDLAGKNLTGIVANLGVNGDGQGTVTKVLTGTSANVGTTGRYIRIYHTDAVDVTLALALTGLKVFAGGVDVAAGKQTVVGADGGNLYSGIHNAAALTDGLVGGAWNLGTTNATSNLAHAGGIRPYIELDLGSVQAIDAIALWGRADVPAESNNLRVYVSDTAFPSSVAAYAALAQNPAVRSVDVASVDTAAVSTFTDTLSGIENIVGTSLNDTLTGDGKANVLTGGAGNDILAGGAGNDNLGGGDGDDTLDGGAGNDVLGGGAGTDLVSGGDGNDQIVQDVGRANDTLNGGTGTDTVDYGAMGLNAATSTGITANLATGKVDKVFAGTSVGVGMSGRYIRIYHTDAASSTTLSLTGMKVFAAGVDVAAGRVSSIGADIGTVDGRLQNPWALTDAAVGGATSTPSSNMAWASAATGSNKPYIELDLGSVQAIYSIALWGNEKYPAESNNLRVFVSDTAFTSSATAYADLSANAAVAMIDVAVVDTAASTIFTDTLTGIENLVGTLRGDRLTGDLNANSLFGDAGNDTLEGGAGNDILAGGAGTDSISGGDGDDLIVQEIERTSETLSGGAGIDTADYSGTDLTGIALTGITANLATGTVNKVFVGTAVGVGVTGRYIRVYHTDATQVLALNALKVFSGGIDVAAGRTSVAGADAGFVATPYNNPAALTDATVGGGWNGGSTPATSSLAHASGTKAYIELDLGSVQSIDSMALWGDGTGQSNNLRVFVSGTAFTSSATAYADLSANAAVAMLDVKVVDTAAATTFTDTLSGIENLIGTTLADSLTGDANNNTLTGGAGNDTLYGGAGDDLLNGGSDNDSLDGGAGDDTLAGGAGADLINGGDGNDRILQVMERSSDTLAGGNGIDTVDYGATDLTGIASTGITASLATGTVNKVFGGTYVGVGMMGRYIRIYHKDAVSAAQTLALTGMKVFVGGVDVAAGKLSSAGVDSGSVGGGQYHNPAALTDGTLGVAWNGGSTSTSSNLAYASGSGAYIELDLGSVQAIDSIALWGRTNLAAESDNLRVYVSEKAFTSATYATLAADATVGRADVAVVDTAATTTFTDTVTGIENVIGTALADRLTGDLNANSLSGEAGNDTLDGGAGNDFLAGGAGTDVINGGDGDDIIAQDIGRFNETLNGGAGIDTVDYSVTDLAGIASAGITANLATGKVTKIFAGTAVGVGAMGRYIRIYHSDAVSATQALSLSGLKVFAGGVDIAAGSASTVGADGGGIGGSPYNNPLALTDGSVGGAWNNGASSSTSNLANVTGTKAYIELDLGSVQAIDSIALWGHTNAPANGNNLRVFVSETAFTSSATAYVDLSAKASVAMVDVAAVDTGTSTTFADTLTGIENLVGTALADSLTGDANTNSLTGGDGNDTLNGQAGNDTLAGGSGTDSVNGGDGNDRILQDMERVSDTLDGGAGIDTVDYSISGMAGGIVASLATGKVDKVLAGTSVDIGTTGRYIRIYHTGAVSQTLALALTGMKVFAAGVDVASGKQTAVGADGGNLYSGIHNAAALTDGLVGGAWNLGTTNATSNLAHAGGNRPYIELDLGSVQSIDSIALWGRADVPAESNNLRMYVSDTAFTSATYATLAANDDVGRVDVPVVDTNASTTFTDTLNGIENLVGTALADSLTGDLNANSLSGGAGNDTLNGGEGNDTLDGGIGNDVLAGGAGSDSVSGGDGDDLILQDVERFGDTLRGGAGIDTVDYSGNGTAGSIVANLATGQVDKVFAGGTSVNVGTRGRYIRIYHYDPTYNMQAISLTGMKVYAGGIDVAAGKPSSTGSDLSGPSNSMNNPYALTDKALGGGWNGQLSSASNLALADSWEGFPVASKPYIEIDLGSVQFIDSIALWGRADAFNQSDKLRIYVSQSAFPKASTAYDSLPGSFGVKKIDVSQVDTRATTFTDTLSGIENLVGTALDDSLTGDAGNNVLSGGAGNDTLNGGAGTDILQGGDGDDRYVFGVGSGQDTIVETSGKDRIVFGAGISAAQVGLSLADGMVKLSLASGDSVSFATTAPGEYAVEQFEFADGTVKDTSWFNSLTNTAPTGASKAVTLNEDGSYVVTINDLGFTDANVGDSLGGVRIDSLPLAGVLKLNGVNVTAAQVVSAADLAAGRLVFSAAANANGNNYTSLAFSVRDQYGAFDAAPKLLTFNVTPVNDAPALTGTQAVLAAGLEDTVYTITQASLLAGFSDAEASALSVLNLAASNGKLSAFNATTKSWTFTPNANYNGVVNLSYSVSDGTLSTSVTQSFTLAAVNDVPTLTAFTAAVSAGNENKETTITLAQLLAQGNEADVDGTVTSFVVKAVSSGTLRIGTSAATATAWNAATNNTIDATRIAFWTPALNASGTLSAFTAVARDDGGAVSATAIQAKVAVNDTPTLTAFAAAVATVNEDTAAAITLAQLLAQGNEADIDGTITAFVIKAVSSGSLRIGASAATATAWDATTNNTVDATRIAYWTPALNANGTLNAFTAVAMDNAGAESATAIQAKVTVTAVNDAPALTGTKAVLAAGVEDTVYTITQASLLAGFSDAEGGTLSVLNLVAANGKLSAFNATTKSWTFTPNANYNGVVNLSYSISDGTLSAPVTQSFTLAAVNDAPTLTAFAAAVATVNEDSPAAITLAQLLAQGNELDVDGTITSFVVKAVSSGSLRIGTSAATATAWDATTNNTVDATRIAYWTPALNANGTLNAFTAVARDNGGAESSAAIQAKVAVTAVNDVPTLTAFAAAVATVNEDTAVAITLTQLLAQGNEADVDGTVTSFVVKAVSSGTLRIGTSGATATAWNATTNNTVDATRIAYWTPALNANGTLNAFTAVARDNGGAESATAVQAKVAVTAVNDAPTLTAFAAAVAAVNENNPAAITLAQLLAQGNELDVDGTITSFVVKAVSGGTLRIGTSAATATAWSATTNNTVDATRIAYWTPALNASGTLNAFTAVAKDNSGLESATAIQAKVAVNDTPTLTAFAAAVATGNEDSPAAITLAQLLAQGNELDVDGTITSFVVKAVNSGTLRIGTLYDTAAAWNATTNNTIDATRIAFWTPALNANGTLNAFTAVAKDNSGAESATAVQATVAVKPVNDAPTGTVTITGIGSPDLTLTAVNTLADVDGLGTIKYQWLANNVYIAGATSARFAPGQAELGKLISVQASYTDLQGGTENTRSTNYVVSEDIVGTALADSLTGDFNANTLSGGAGNDILAGGAGSDTYLFARGGGVDVVRENDAAAGNKDVLRFDASIDASQIWLRKINNDLELSLIGTSDRVTVAGWYTGQSAHVEEIYAGGKKLLDTNVDKLVSAMAGFNPPAAGQTTLPANLQTALKTVMAANWTAA